MQSLMWDGLLVGLLQQWRGLLMHLVLSASKYGGSFHSIQFCQLQHYKCWCYEDTNCQNYSSRRIPQHIFKKLNISWKLGKVGDIFLEAYEKPERDRHWLKTNICYNG